MTRLALHGGTPEVIRPHPHADRARFSDADRRAILAYLADDANPNSFLGRDGLLKTYEEELAAYFGRRYCVLTNSGTSALHTAFFAAGLEPGDEIIAPTYTFHATVTPAFHLGAVPVLADVEPDTGNVDPKEVERLITPRTRAVVATHQWGHPFDGPALRDVAERHRLVLIEDLSLAVGAELDGVRTGRFGHVGCFSLGSTKLLSGGQGGALVLDDPVMWERANLLGHFSRRCYDTVQSPMLRQFADTGYGYNYRMHALAIAVSRQRLHHVDELIASRHERYAILSQALAETGVLDPPVTRPGVTRGSWQGYCAIYRGAEAGTPLERFVEALQAEGLEVSARGYHLPLHFSRLFQTKRDGMRSRVPAPENRRAYRLGDFPVAESHVERLIGFPLFLDEDVRLVEGYGRACRKVAEHMKELADTVPASG